MGSAVGRISLDPGEFSVSLSDPPLILVADNDHSTAHRPSSEEREKRDPNRILFRDLLQSRFAMLGSNPLYHRFEMCFPPVSTANGNVVLPSQYENMIPDGTMVAVHGKMKMWVLAFSRISSSFVAYV